MEAGRNAIDFAEFGRLFLNEGNWDGVQVIPRKWVDESTNVESDLHNPGYYRTDCGHAVYDGHGYYQYVWYCRLRDASQAD